MKRFLIACTLIIIVAVLCSVGSWYLKNTHAVIDEMLDNLLEHFEQGDMQQTAQAARALEKEWVKREKYLSIFIDHQKIDNIGISIAKLEPLAQLEAHAEFLAECKLAKVMLLHVINDEKISLESVL